jgi:putative heme-binding domain-containing protein
MTRALRSFAVLLSVSSSLAAYSAAQDPISSPTPEDLAQGKRLFVGHCAVCHGIEGTGGRGPSLNQPVLRRVANDFALFLLIRQGVDGSEMPGAWQMSDREVRLVAGYVRSLGRVPVVKLPGDPERGQALYDSKGCAACHIVRGKGASFGPDISEIGARRSPAYLREALLDPGASAPEDFLIVSAIDRSGNRIRGIRASEDSFTIQLRDAGNRFHSLRKSNLRELKKEFGVSTMPGYRDKLSASEIDDLIAYLAGLRGEK